MQTRTAIVGLSLLALSGVAYAESGWSSSITPYGRYQFETDLDEAGSFSVIRTGAAFKTGGAVTDTVFGAIAFDAEYSNYDSNDTSIPSDFVFIDFRPSVSVNLNENLSVFGGLILGAGGEPDADVGDSLMYGGFAGFNYQLAKGVSVGTGVGFTTQLEDDAIILPLLNLTWAISDNLTLEANGLSAKLSYKVDDAWTVFAEGSYEFRQYRLADDAAIASGVFSDEWVPLGVGVSYTPADNITVSVSGGAIVWQQVEFFDDDENSLSEIDADVTGYVSASVKIAW